MRSSADELNYPGFEQYSSSELVNVGGKPLVRPTPILRAWSTSHILFDKPDLDTLQRFLLDFGLVTAEKSSTCLRMRGTGFEPFIYEARKAERSRYRGIALNLREDADFAKIGAALGQTPQKIDAPGGGRKFVLSDPNGFEVHLLYEREHVAELSARDTPYPFNTPDVKQRVNAPLRPALRATPLVRFGHVVIQSPDFEETVQWYMRYLGMIPTDVFCLQDGTPNMVFLRLDCGDRLADHHNVVVFGAPGPAKYGHSAYEALDIDALGQGQQVLKHAGWDHHWGIGRHIFGSQLFDYWRDPWGDEMEHYADGDVFQASHPTNYHILDRGGLWMWGQDLPLSMRPKPSLREIVSLFFAAITKKLDVKFLKQLQTAMSRKPRPWLK